MGTESNGKMPVTKVIDLVEKLFGTLSEALNKQSETTQKVYDSMREWLTIAKNEPRNTDLMNEIKRIEEGGFDLPITTVQAHQKINSIDDKVDKISKRVNTMIIAVVVAFSMLAGSYFLVRAVVDKDVESIIKEQLDGTDSMIQYRLNEEEIMEKMDKLSNEIDRLEKKMEEYRCENEEAAQ